MGLLKFSWYIANATLSLVWLKQRFMMDEFLSGEWDGDLIHVDNAGVPHGDYFTTCKLMVTKNKDKNNSAYIYYDMNKFNNGEVVSVGKGFDKLINHTPYWNFFCDRKWTPQFRRVFHRIGDDVNHEGVIYDFECQVPSFFNLFYSQKLNVRTKIKDGRYAVGVLSKN